MKITIIGSGNIGGTLGVKWAKANHQVTFGVRDVNDKVKQQLAAAGSNAKADSIANALLGSDVVLLAIPANAVAEFLENHADALNGKIVLDATNLIGGGDKMHHVDEILQAAPKARVYRAFNSMPWEVFENPIVNGQQATMFYVGPAEWESIVAQLAGDIGVEPMYLGDYDQLATLDNLTRVIFILAFQRGYGRVVALKALHN
jgi:8-hydroxy-5-deazaflavin:NADPH oxidoreductase